MYAMDVPTTQIGVSASQNLCEEESPFVQPNIDNSCAVYQVFHAASIIRAEIQTVENNPPWPPRPDYLKTYNIQMPDLLFSFLCWVLHGNTSSHLVSEERVEVPATTRRTALSLPQYLVHIKNPKHVAFPLTVKQLSRSVQLVEMLNNFGHGLCNSLIQEVETAFAQRYLTDIEEDGSLSRRIFTLMFQLCFAGTIMT